VSWNGRAYLVYLTVRQAGRSTSFEVATFDQLFDRMEEVLKDPYRKWGKWEPSKGTAAYRDMMQERSKLKDKGVDFS